MFTFHNFRSALFVLLVSLTSVTLFPVVSIAQTQPVIVTITQIEQLGDDFDPILVTSMRTSRSMERRTAHLMIDL